MVAERAIIMSLGWPLDSPYSLQVTELFNQLMHPKAGLTRHLEQTEAGFAGSHP